MLDFPTTRLQKILGEGQTHAELDARNQRVQIELFIGNYIATWAHVDLFLGMAASAWSGVTQKEMLRRTTNQKIQALEAHLPPGWDDGARLTAHLHAGNRFRNGLAHFSLAAGGWSDGEHLGWHLWDVKGLRARLRLGDAEMAARRAMAQVLRDAVLASMQYLVLQRTRGDEASLHELIVATPGTWDTRDEFMEYRRCADEMFA